MVKLFFDRAAALTNLDPGMLEVIKQCNNVIRVRCAPGVSTRIISVNSPNRRRPTPRHRT